MSKNMQQQVIPAESQHVGDASIPSGQVVTRDEAAQVAQARALESLVTVLSPVIQQVMDTSRAAERDGREHELRAMQLEAEIEDRRAKRELPLVWYIAIVVTLVIGWACYVGRWEIATHVLTAALAWVAAKATKNVSERKREEEPSP
jgi:hypothetical protein